MPTVNPSPIGVKLQVELAAGTPAVGYKLFTYVAGSVNTKTNTYTDSTGTVANTNPIVLNALGQPTTEIWIPAGVSVKHVLAPSTDTDPPTSPVWSVDNLRGINDTSVTIDQWVAGPAPTFVGGTQFTLAGDQTSTFQVGRRVKVTDSVTAKYGRITVSTYDGVSLTTVTIVNDGAVLVTPLSAVSYGLLSATNPSVPAIIDGAGAAVVTYPAGRPTVTVSDSTAFKPLTAAVAGNALTATLASGTLLNFNVAGVNTAVTTSGALTVTASSGSTLGTSNGVRSRIWVVAVYNGGTPELAIINCQNGATGITALNVAETITTVAEGGAGAADSSGVFYSTTLRSSQPFTVLGFIESTQATAGTWVTSPAKTQGFGMGIPLPGSVLQVVQTTSASGNTISSGTATDVTNSSLSITPGNACNSVRFKTSGAMLATNAGAANNQFSAQFLRGSTNIAGTDWFVASLSTGAGGGGVQSNYAYEKLDWPQAATATTYKTQGRAMSAAGSVTFSSLTVIAEEVMA